MAPIDFQKCITSSEVYLRGVIIVMTSYRFLRIGYRKSVFPRTQVKKVRGFGTLILGSQF